MMFQSTVFLAIASLCLTTDAFVVTSRSSGPAQLSQATAASKTTPSTWSLYMADEGEASDTNTEQQDTTAAGDDGGASDILNSPAFLKRKLEVLKSDIEKTEADVEAALERAEVAKEEWGPQLEDLQREVSLSWLLLAENTVFGLQPVLVILPSASPGDAIKLSSQLSSRSLFIFLEIASLPPIETILFDTPFPIAHVF